MEKFDFIVVGSGMGGLSAGAILAHAGHSLLVLEKGTSPGGCASSYKKAGYIFEAGATTVVGLDPGLPLERLQSKLGITFPGSALEIPMKIHGLGPKPVVRQKRKEDWIEECISNFGSPRRQRVFWWLTFFFSQRLWDLSGRFVHFPPNSISDFWKCFVRIKLLDLIALPFSFISLGTVLKVLGLAKSVPFERFLTEQLLITTQTTPRNTPYLASTAGLTYPNLTNYYIKGGIIKLPQTLIQYIQAKGGLCQLKETVQRIEKQGDSFLVKTNRSTYQAQSLISNIPIWNLVEIYEGEGLSELQKIASSFEKGIWGAFTMGIAIKVLPGDSNSFDCLHHQLHLSKPLPLGGGNSIFISLSEEKDTERSPQGIRILAVSTHIKNPDLWNRDENYLSKKKELETAIFSELAMAFPWFQLDKIVFSSSASPVTWQTWTGRKSGRVGGLPASYFFNPFKYPSSLTTIPGLYRTGDTAYPGQGIPAVVLGGMNLAERILEKKRG